MSARRAVEPHSSRRGVSAKEEASQFREVELRSALSLAEGPEHLVVDGCVVGCPLPDGLERDTPSQGALLDGEVRVVWVLAVQASAQGTTRSAA
jgi:hypothetical protein